MKEGDTVKGRNVTIAFAYKQQYKKEGIQLVQHQNCQSWQKYRKSYVYRSYRSLWEKSNSDFQSWLNSTLHGRVNCMPSLLLYAIGKKKCVSEYLEEAEL